MIFVFSIRCPHRERDSVCGHFFTACRLPLCLTLLFGYTAFSLLRTISATRRDSRGHFKGQFRPAASGDWRVPGTSILTFDTDKLKAALPRRCASRALNAAAREGHTGASHFKGAGRAIRTAGRGSGRFRFRILHGIASCQGWLRGRGSRTLRSARSYSADADRYESHAQPAGPGRRRRGCQRDSQI